MTENHLENKKKTMKTIKKTIQFLLKIFFLIQNIFKSKETKKREMLVLQLIAERNRLLIANKNYLKKFSGQRRYTKAVPTNNNYN